MTSLLLTGVIAILPKCPLCALAYSTAITMCSGTVYDHTADWTSYISIFLAATTLVLVLWNYKGLRTLAAATAVILGGAFIIHSELVTGNTTTYYAGCAVVLAGVWFNGSFLHFLRKWFAVSTPVANKIHEAV